MSDNFVETRKRGRDAEEDVNIFTIFDDPRTLTGTNGKQVMIQETATAAEETAMTAEEDDYNNKNARNKDDFAKPKRKRLVKNMHNLVSTAYDPFYHSNVNDGAVVDFIFTPTVNGKSRTFKYTNEIVTTKCNWDHEYFTGIPIGVPVAVDFESFPNGEKVMWIHLKGEYCSWNCARASFYYETSLSREEKEIAVSYLPIMRLYCMYDDTLKDPKQLILHWKKINSQINAPIMTTDKKLKEDLEKQRMTFRIPPAPHWRVLKGYAGGVMTIEDFRKNLEQRWKSYPENVTPLGFLHCKHDPTRFASGYKHYANNYHEYMMKAYEQNVVKGMNGGVLEPVVKQEAVTDNSNAYIHKKFENNKTTATRKTYLYSNIEEKKEQFEKEEKEENKKEIEEKQLKKIKDKLEKGTIKHRIFTTIKNMKNVKVRKTKANNLKGMKNNIEIGIERENQNKFLSMPLSQSLSQISNKSKHNAAAASAAVSSSSSSSLTNATLNSSRPGRGKPNLNVPSTMEEMRKKIAENKQSKIGQGSIISTDENGRGKTKTSTETAASTTSSSSNNNNQPNYSETGFGFTSPVRVIATSQKNSSRKEKGESAQKKSKKNDTGLNIGQTTTTENISLFTQRKKS